MSVSNSILTDAVIAKEAMMEFHNNLAFLKGVNRQYSNQFAKSGAKIGNTINVKKANRFAVQQGPAITAQGVSESTVPLTLNRQYVVPMSFSSADRTLSIDQFNKNYIKPAMSKLASWMDLDACAAAITGSYLDGTSCPGAGPIYNVIGTPGTTPGTGGGSATGLLQYNAPSVYLNAGVVLDNNAAPRDGRRSVVLNPAAQAASVGSLSGLFNPQGIISEQYRKGMMGNALDFDFAMDQNIYTFTSGTRAISGEITVQATWTTATGANILLTGGTGTIKAGDSFTVAGVYAVNPENQQSTGVLQQFVVTSSVTMSGTTTVAISPTPKLADGSTIADGNVNRVPTAGDAVVWTTGAASTASPQNLAYHADAFTLGTADLETNLPGATAIRETMDGISMRLVTFYDGMSDYVTTRVDVLAGFSVQRPEWAVRIAG